MNASRSLLSPWNFLYRIVLHSRRLLPRQRCQTFGRFNANRKIIEQIYVINLDRQTDRWTEMRRELKSIVDATGTQLVERTVRHPALDGSRFEQVQLEDGEVEPFYTLGDQLFVEPQPRAFPDRLELDRPIRMSQPEIAVARSHIDVWRRVATGEHSYALVLEDDIWFQRGFARYLDRAWGEIEADGANTEAFDILYLSYKEVKHGAQKIFLSRSVFRPVRGLWYLSGYVLSREGAAKLLTLLPCRGPIDLWINRQFGALDVRATARSIISQRRDGSSTNSYSILPALTRIGVLESEASSLFQSRPQQRPVFVFGAANSGLSSLAMALSMLGYRCCSDLDDLPKEELQKLLAGRTDRVFDAYVNIGTLTAKARTLMQKYPRAKFVVTTPGVEHWSSGALDISADMGGGDISVLPAEASDKWKIVCQHLKCAPPVAAYPRIADIGQRHLLHVHEVPYPIVGRRDVKRDSSPWVVQSRREWRGIRCTATVKPFGECVSHVRFSDCFEDLETKRWFLRDDTFPGNLALFRPANVEFRRGLGAVLCVKNEPLGVRHFSAASISSRDRFLFGRFEASIRAANVSGIVTGFFLHRDSPRQEIDVEIVGIRSDRLLVNVFYNPGDPGAKFDYGYRGAPSIVELGFDASESSHRFAIEWEPCEIRWLVDEQIVHTRANWDPTPIPQLPMALHVNMWPSRSRQLAGRLASRRLPATAVVSSIHVEANVAQGRTEEHSSGAYAAIAAPPRSGRKKR
ncbi:MAG TPA: family 16 glycosylhydrolase [Thermoanaerobaculia bacterium]|nr:family 16 glycosylhydrolase [Thermoanaerobaculia bacterium]